MDEIGDKMMAREPSSDSSHRTGWSTGQVSPSWHPGARGQIRQARAASGLGQTSWMD